MGIKNNNNKNEKNLQEALEICDEDNTSQVSLNLIYTSESCAIPSHTAIVYINFILKSQTPMTLKKHFLHPLPLKRICLSVRIYAFMTVTSNAHIAPLNGVYLRHRYDIISQLDSPNVGRTIIWCEKCIIARIVVLPH